MGKRDAGSGPDVANRTLRKLSLEKGANPSGFTPRPDIDPAAGVPTSEAGGDYKDPGEAVKGTSASPAPVQSTPFRLKG